MEEAQGAAIEGAPGRPAQVFTAVGLTISATIAVAGEPWRGWLLVTLVAATATTGVVAVRRDPARSNPAWWLLLGAVALVPAYVLWYPAQVHLGLELRSPSIADWLFLAAYAAFVVGLTGLIRQRSTSGDRRVHLVDSLIISVGLVVVVWVVFIAPYLRDDELSWAARIVAVSYTVVDLLLLGAVVRMLVQGQVASVGDRLLTGWIGSQLVADLVYSVTTLQGTFDVRGATGVLYAISFTLLGAALLHPSTLCRAQREVAPRSTSGGRWVLTTGPAALIAPAVLVLLGVQGNSEDVPIVALLSAVLFVLVLLRVWLLMVDVREHQRIQDQLAASVQMERQHVAANDALLVSLRARQMLSDRLFAIQRMISTRAPLQDVLDAVTAGAAHLLSADMISLCLLDETDTDYLVMVSSVGVSPDMERALHRLPASSGIGGRALIEDRVCVQSACPGGDGGEGLASTGLRSAMGAPVHEEARPIGSLVAASYDADRRFTASEQEALAAFAEHVSLALNDARTVQAMREALDQAVHQAMHDELTGLPNRACFYDRTEQALRAARRDSCATAVLLFDLDRFKEINDTLGHRYGDRVLRAIGPRIQPLLRDADTLARLGGDEFCVLLPRIASTAAAVAVARRITAALEEPFEVEGMNMVVEASCGVAIAPMHGDTADLLLQRADVAMYVSKTSHQSVLAYETRLDRNTPDRLSMLADLRSAISGGGLVVHYQPQADLATGAVVAVEALVRWEHPRLGLVGPDQFIPMAEDTGLIRSLTSWVLAASLAQLRRWLDDPDFAAPDLAVAVNLSTRSLLDESIREEVVAALLRYEIPAHRLVLEVTETTLMADPARAHRLLSDLAAVGVRFAIDDFGTGYSSLASLKSLPVHHLKIDKSFVACMHEDVNDATIVRSVIDLARTLGLRTVAEGVERPETWAQLAELGCDLAQGYLLARAMPADELGPWLREQRRSRLHVVAG